MSHKVTNTLVINTLARPPGFLSTGPKSPPVTLSISSLVDITLNQAAPGDRAVIQAKYRPGSHLDLLIAIWQFGPVKTQPLKKNKTKKQEQ